MIKGLEDQLYGERLGDLGPSSLGKRRPMEDVVASVSV